MSTKQQDGAKTNTSSVLFITADGEPMSFFLRPGPVKRKLQPLITSGGGMLCNIQQPGAILLIDPGERSSICESTAHWYVSTNYISDCIERKERLNIEDYRLNPEVVPRHSTRLKSKGGSSEVLGGRIPYTPEDDAAILNYVCKHKNDTGGNRLWQAMEKEHVTNHSWQSMKYHYRVQLAKKQSSVKEVKIDEEETKKEGNQETDVQKPFNEDSSSPQTHLAETDLIQIDAQPIPAEITQPENLEAGTSNSHQSGMPCLDPPTNAHPVPAENKQTETAEPITTMSPQEETVSDDSLQSCHCSLTPENPKQPKQSPSTEVEQPQRRLTRRQLEHEMSSSSEPYGKKLRSSTSIDKQLLSPQSTKKTRSPVIKQTTTDSPPSKRPRGNSVAAVAESQQDESEEAAIFETPEAEQPVETTAEELKLLPQTVEKKKEKKKLGILELATKEFEDESESAESETQDLENPTETAAVQLTSTEPLLPPTDQAVGPTSTQSDPEPETGFQEKAQQPHASSSNSGSEPAATEAVHVSSRGHKFIFDHESQEEHSQSLLGNTSSALSNPQPPVDMDVAFSLTQVQLEEDKQRIRELMDQTNQDLASVTKALLRTSGDFSAALDLLLDPSSISGPFWNQHDDSLLRSADPVLLLQLKEKYSEEEVAKRTVFLEVAR